MVRVDGNVILEATNGQIDPENKTCTLKSGTRVSCLTIKGCLKYEGDAVDSELEFQVTFKLDTKKAMPRLFFLNEEGSHEQTESLHLQKGKKLCKWSYIYLLPNVKDKLSSLEVQMTYAIKENHLNTNDLSPIIDPRQNSRALNDAASILKDCGLDNICIPDLQIAHDVSMAKYLIGSEEKLELNLNITNEGEDAYEASLYVQLPRHVSYIRTESTNDMVSSVLCSPPTLENGFVLKCDLGNPMMAFSMISLRTVLKPNIDDGNAMPIEIKLHANCSNPELTTSLDNNQLDLNIPVYVETDFVIRGLSDPDPLSHNASAYLVPKEDIRHESEIGPELVHIYQVENRGPSDILEAQVFILWPSFRPNEEPLLYLTSQPIVEGLARCEIVEDVNPFNVEIDRFHIRSISQDRPDFSSTDYDSRVLDRPKRDSDGLQIQMEYKEFSSELEPNPRDQDLLDQLDCGPTKCTHMACTVGPLKKKESAVFRIYSRLWSGTISKLSHSHYEISSRLVAIVTKLPHNVDPSFLDIKSYTGKSLVCSAHHTPLQCPYFFSNIQSDLTRGRLGRSTRTSLDPTPRSIGWSSISRHSVSHSLALWLFPKAKA